MKYKIVADSACNIVSGEDGAFASVPMKIVAEREYVDDANLDVAQMVEDLKQYKGKSGSSCPNVGEWLEAFGDAEEVFGITISKHGQLQRGEARRRYVHVRTSGEEGVHL